MIAGAIACVAQATASLIAVAGWLVIVALVPCVTLSQCVGGFRRKEPKR